MTRRRIRAAARPGPTRPSPSGWSATNPLPNTSATDLDDDLGRRNNATRAGLPANFFVVNPALDDVNVTDSGAFSDYHALQLELKRRLSKGLQANVSYQYAVEGGSQFLGFRYGREMNPAANVRHAIKTQWDWEIPVGRGQRFGSTSDPILNGILGGWQFNGVGRIQARTINFGNVRLVGMTVDELTSAYKHDVRVNPDTACRRSTTCRRTSSTTPGGRSTSARRARPATRRWACRKAATSRRRTAPTACSSRPATARHARCSCAPRGSRASTSA